MSLYIQIACYNSERLALHGTEVYGGNSAGSCHKKDWVSSLHGTEVYGKNTACSCPKKGRVGSLNGSASHAMPQVLVAAISCYFHGNIIIIANVDKRLKSN